MDELLNIYISYRSSSHELKYKINVCVSNNSYLSLKEYIFVCMEYCLLHHDQPSCSECSALIKAANLIADNGFYPMSVAFKSCFPNVTYSSAIAKRKLVQLPLAAITIGTPASGKSEVYLMEAVGGLDYRKLIQFLQSKISHGVVPGITKQQMKELLSFAQSDRERERLQYSICKSSGLTSTAARRIYGWEKMSDRSTVETCL